MLKQQQFRSRRATARRAMLVDSCEPLRKCTKTHMKRLAIGEWLGKVTQGHLNFRYLIGHTELHRRVITSLSCTISRILSHLLKSQTDSMRQLKLQAICSFWFMCTHTVVDTVKVQELERFQIAKVTFEVIPGQWQWCHSRRHMWLPIRLPLQLCLYLALFPRYC